mgnify:CR=1 FL=1|jgi:hypothetical protein
MDYWQGLMLALCGVCVLLLVKAGLLGVAAVAVLAGMLLITPLLIDRFRFFLFLWLFISPAFDNMRAFLVAGANPVVFLVTGLTLPFALLLLARDLPRAARALPYLGWLLAFNLVVFINLFRPEAEQGILLEGLKLTIEIFIVLCGLREMQAGRGEGLFRGVNLFMIANSLIAVFQRVSGIGMTLIEGLPRVGGLVGHPNCLAFVNVLYLPFGIYQAMQATNRKERWFWLAGVGISAVALLLTLCKNVIFTWVLQLMCLFLFLPNRLKLRVGLSALVLSAVFLGADAVLHLGFIDQFNERLNNSDSMVWRFKIWGHLLDSIDAPGLLLGNGVHSARALIHMIDSRGSDYVHNAYLQLLFDYGLSGLLYIVAFWQPTWVFARRFLRAKPALRLRWMMPLLILAAIWINMGSDNSVFLRTPMSYAWLMLTFFYRLPEQPGQEEVPTSS